jgi:uncharacterized protein YkwD
MPRLASVAASLLLALGTFVYFGPAALVTAQDAGYAPDDQEWAFVELLNAYRGEIGLAPLTMNYELGAAADYHASDMAMNNYFDHYSLAGVDPGTNISNFGYTGFPYAENIAAGMETAQDVLIGWQNSPEHNGTMTNPQYTEIGVGRAYGEGSYYGWYWTATYGAGEAAAPAPELLAAPVETAPAPELVAAPVESAETTTVVTQIESDGTTTYYEPPTVVTNDGGVVELEQGVVNADGDRAVSTGANPVADGTGDTIIYGDINTGGVMGESIVYEPPSLNVSDGTIAPAPVTTTTTTTTTTATTPIYVPPEEPAPIITDPTLTETTTTVIEMNDGTGRAIG